MTDNHDKAAAAAKRAAKLFSKRDQLAAQLDAIDREIKQTTSDYASALRVWGFTPLMLRQACKARGLMERAA